MRAADAVTQLRPRLSLRGRLYLFSGAILILFAINVGTSLWGSFARNESSIAYQETVNASQLTAELEQNLQNKRQQVLVLATLRVIKLQLPALVLLLLHQTLLLMLNQFQ